MSRRYDNLKYLYTTDLGSNKYKWQRAYYVEENGIKRYTTPITSLFLARVVTTNGKTAGSSATTRRLLTYLKENNIVIERTVNIPYRPLDPFLLLQIEETLALESVICGDYLGESPLQNSK